MPGEGEVGRSRAWSLELDAQAWDREIGDDVAAGRLDALAEEALSDLRAGRTRPFLASDPGNYTEEREALFEGVTLDDILSEVRSNPPKRA